MGVRRGNGYRVSLGSDLLWLGAKLDLSPTAYGTGITLGINFRR